MKETAGREGKRADPERGGGDREITSAKYKGEGERGSEREGRGE